MFMNKSKNIVFHLIKYNYHVHQGSVPGRVIPKTQKMVLDAALLSTQQYEVRIKGKVEQSRKWSRAALYTSV